MDGERSISLPATVQKQYARLSARMMQNGAEPMTISGRREIVGMGRNGRLLAYLYHGQLVVKLPPSQAAFFFNAELVQPFNNERGERLFEWVLVPRGSEWVWDRLVDDAFTHA